MAPSIAKATVITSLKPGDAGEASHAPPLVAKSVDPTAKWMVWWLRPAAD